MENTETTSDIQRVEKLESLVSELLKDAYDEESIEKKMGELKIPYTSDPLERLNRVLESLHPYQILEDSEL